MKLFKCFDQIYVINLDSRPDRILEFKESIMSLGLSEQDFNKIIRFSGIVPSSGIGALGCTLSHLEIIKDAKTKGYSKILVFEDDAYPFKNGIEYLDEVLDDISSQAWDVYYLGYNSHEKLDLYSKNSLKAKSLYSTHAIAYNSTFFEKFIEDFEKNRIPIFDVWISEHIQTSMNCLASYPMIFIQRESYSDIEKKNVNYEIQLERYQNFTSHLPEPFKKI